MTDSITPISSHPTEDEITKRLNRVQEELKTLDLDFYLAFNPDNIFYLTNFANYVHERPFILLVPSSGTPVFLMPKLEEPHVRIRSVGKLNYLHYFEFPAPKGQQWSDRLNDVLAPKHRVGIESTCPVFIAKNVAATTVETDIVDKVRMIKSDYEVGRIAYTSKLVSQAHAQLLDAARPGRMIVEVHSKATAAITKKLLLNNPNSNLLNTKFAAIAQPPELSHDPHNFTDVSMTFTQGGPHVSIASGTANGYGAEVERTFFINHVPEAAKRPFDDMLEARALAYDLTRPGNLMSEVDIKVNEFLKSKGYEDNLLHRTGHSFGVTNHEAPFLAEGYDHEIKPGMVFSIEPGIYLEGLGGFRFSDTILVTREGNTTLTQAPRTLDQLTIKRKPSFIDKAKALVVNHLSRKT